MKICFLTLNDPEDKRSWSGIFFQMYSRLKIDNEVEWVGPVTFRKWQSMVLKAREVYYRYSKKQISLENAFFSSCYAKNVIRKIEQNKYDLIFAPVSSSLITALETSIPIVYFSDATFDVMIDYYPQFTGLSKKQIEEAHKIEKRTLSKVKYAIYSSEWARKSAISFYQTDPNKVFFFEMGANLLRAPANSELDFSESTVCRILFLGVDWSRKGGETAYRAFLELKRRGFRCTLTIIGCNPQLSPDDDIEIIPFLNKNKKEDFDRFFAIFQQTHILLLPSKAECFGIVFAEASAFGVPSVATRTGGIPSAVSEGVNGFLLDVNAKPEEFADKIERIFSDTDLFRKLRLSSRREYETRLNWDVWSVKFNQCIKPLFASN